MSKPFLKLMKTDETTELLVNAPNAFTLLYQIALRAKRAKGQFDVNGLDVCQAMVGDHQSIGLTEQKYRTAKGQLEKWGFARFEATSKGTIATLINSRVFDINEQAIQRSSNDQITDGTTTRATDKKRAKKQSNPDAYSDGKKQSNDQCNDHRNANVTTNKNKEYKNTDIGACPYEAIVDLFHHHLSELPRVFIITKERKNTLRARWNTSNKTRSLQWWEQFFTAVSESKFLMGEIADKKWCASFDWVIKKKNFFKIIEGNYR